MLWNDRLWMRGDAETAALCAALWHDNKGRCLMVKIELSAQEAEELAGILEDYLSDLRMEIVDTEAHDFREGLKKRKELVGRVVDQLKASRS
jgi:hypothetical protein